MKTCAIYHRVSTTDQDQTLARDELRAAAHARGLTIALDIEETGSGARNDRPGLQRVLEAVRRGEVGAVLVWKLDRFGRSSLDLLANVEALEHAGCAFECITQGITIKPGGDAVSRLLLTMLAGVAAFERDLIIERTKLGLAKAKRNGKKLGRPRRIFDVAAARRMKAAGKSLREIAVALKTPRATVARALAS
jgi:putative DNA-invertase from lambdoid prophage Rac